MKGLIGRFVEIEQKGEKVALEVVHVFESKLHPDHIHTVYLLLADEAGKLLTMASTECKLLADEIESTTKGN